MTNGRRSDDVFIKTGAFVGIHPPIWGIFVRSDHLPFINVNDVAPPTFPDICEVIRDRYRFAGFVVINIDEVTDSRSPREPGEQHFIVEYAFIT